ncbi:MAG: hypothetical protein LBU18_05720 [Treponema sp.]|jgi:hypothetical protein|nr:hypothetical protein [Treponema sp.]
MKSAFLLFCLIALAVYCDAQDDYSAYLIPQTVFVGDQARLAIPLDAAFAGAVGRAILDNPEELPSTPGLIVSKIELENRGGSWQLLIDFTAFIPGVIELPPIKIASLTFTGLTVTVTSILETEGNVSALSEPAPPLTVPGTLGMIYGVILGIAASIAGFALLFLKGGPMFRNWREEFRRRRLIWSMGRVLRRLRNFISQGDSGEASKVLDRLSTDFRGFLGSFTGMNCLAMTGEEFLFLPSLTAEPSGPFLRDFFRRCDILRFSGTAVESQDASEMLDKAADFIGRIEKQKGTADAGEPGLFQGITKREEKAV